MNITRAFGEGFLDGFTMAGLRKLRNPASSGSLLAPDEPEPGTVSFRFSGRDFNDLHVQGDLRGLSTGALNSIIKVVAAEQQSRHTKDALAHGSSK